MFRISGTLSSKSLIKTGVADYGSWKATTFLIKKTRKKKKIVIPLVARGYWADIIDQTPVGEKLGVEFYIEGRKYKDNYYPNCVVINVSRKEKKKKVKDELNFKKSKITDYFVKDKNLFNNINKEI